MFKFRALSRKYFSSRIAKVELTRVMNPAKNYIHFTHEDEFTEKGVVTQLNSAINHYNPAKISDINKHKMGVIYPWNKDLFFTDRMLVVKSPVNDFNKLRSLACKAIRKMQGYQPEEVNILFSDQLPIHHRRIIINSLILSNYTFNVKGEVPTEQDGKTNEQNDEEETKKQDFIPKINIVHDKYMEPLTDSISLWINLANSTLFTRNLANERPNTANCDYLEEVAAGLAKGKDNVTMEVIKGEELLDKGLNLIYSVGKSAETAPRMIILTYKGNEESDVIEHAVVGKGLTFDSGGLNLKPTNYIEDMYLDKHGACNALAIFKSVVDMGWKTNFVCAIGVAENAIGSRSYKPSDIIKSYKGLTVEITNTDAEGRLVLADTLSYLQEQYNPQNIIDMATLTGACVVALVRIYIYI